MSRFLTLKRNSCIVVDFVVPLPEHRRPNLKKALVCTFRTQDMDFNARIRSIFIVLVGLVCLVLNYCWQYQHCCNMLNSFDMMRHANEGFRPPIFFSVDRNKTSQHELIVRLSKLKHKHRFGIVKNKEEIPEKQSLDKKLQDGDGVVAYAGLRKHTENTKLRKGFHKNNFTNLLIVSQGRSGSSFVGQIFNHFPDIFFLYEPLLTIERVHNIDTFVGNNTEHYQEFSTKFLSEIFSCNFTKSPYLEYLSRPGHFRLSSRVLTSPPFCSKDAINLTSNEIIAKNKCTRIQANALSKICKNYTFKVAKVLEHRLPNRTIKQIHELLEKTDYSGKILYLYRDPRALISSMYQSGWISHFRNKQLMPYELTSEKFHWYVKRICFQMEENLKYVQNQPQWPLGNIMLFRYEDLVMHTRDATRKLFAFVGMRTTHDLNEWLYHQMHTRNSTDRGIAARYSIARNSTSAMIRWRTESSIQLVSVIEQHCKSVMDSMGYIAINGSLSVLHDLSTSLVKDI